jgi:hypothetical protein
MSFLQERRTKIQLQESPIEEFPVAGIPQWSPLSLILFLFYNADFMEEINAKDPRSAVSSYINNVGALAFRRSSVANCQLLQRAHAIAEK